MPKEESRYHHDPYLGQKNLNQITLNVLNTELKNSGIDAIDRLYATVVQKPKFELFKQTGIYPTLGKCLCKLKYRKCQGLCISLGKTLDHGELWYKDSKPNKYIAQPYVLTKSEIEKLNQVCNEHGFDYKIRGDSFHFSGATFLIEIFVRKNK
ncbi:hypothetical protein BUZ51_08220 [Staphylococcus hominis]|uniref:Uncharacterized protein n=2 Tax=Staphylococcus hominis TaxID=1290 RepID=A0A974KXB2_STAHO|nr:hypothetical protein [Staphylococcus hominis]PTK30286.1 hypothetical protein BUZ51_08220 [Staphylococcus hominis]